ncbi:hypothetical protein BHE74_00002280 [Ensete ventricosum]|nr:hypothetical protein BHE74_00002280 [Ensete ventricosum]
MPSTPWTAGAEVVRHFQRPIAPPAMEESLREPMRGDESDAGGYSWDRRGRWKGGRGWGEPPSEEFKSKARAASERRARQILSDQIEPNGAGSIRVMLRNL